MPAWPANYKPWTVTRNGDISIIVDRKAAPGGMKVIVCDKCPCGENWYVVGFCQCTEDPEHVPSKPGYPDPELNKLYVLNGDSLYRDGECIDGYTMHIVSRAFKTEAEAISYMQTEAPALQTYLQRICNPYYIVGFCDTLCETPDDGVELPPAIEGAETGKLFTVRYSQLYPENVCINGLRMVILHANTFPTKEEAESYMGSNTNALLATLGQMCGAGGRVVDITLTWDMNAGRDLDIRHSLIINGAVHSTWGWAQDNPGWFAEWYYDNTGGCGSDGYCNEWSGTSEQVSVYLDKIKDAYPGQNVSVQVVVRAHWYGSYKSGEVSLSVVSGTLTYSDRQTITNERQDPGYDSAYTELCTIDIDIDTGRFYIAGAAAQTALVNELPEDLR